MDTSLLSFAHELADIAGDIVRRYFRTSLSVNYKTDLTPVSQADKEVESAIKALIMQRYPQHGILGEEHGNHNISAEHVWVIDPIDGTKAFLAGKPTFCTLIALARQERPVLGIIDQPITRERWAAMEGSITLMNHEAARVRPAATLAESVLSTTSPYLFNHKESAAFERVRERTRHVVLGCDAYAYALLASGGLDIVIESGLKPFDYMALAPVVTGAGGMITDWQGKPLSLSSSGSIIAASSHLLHQEALALLNG